MSHEANTTEAPAPSTRPGLGGVLGLAALLLGVGGVGWGALGRAREREQEVANAPRQDGPRNVLVVRAQRPTGDATLSLPGTVQTNERATIYARAQGYVRAVRVNIGDRVRAGQQLLELETPELDAQLRSAQARVREAQANVPLARTQLDRMQGMADAGLAATVEYEAAQQRFITAQANVNATNSELMRLRSLVRMELVLSPFEGTVVRRLVDPGALVVPGTTALFEVATTQRLKVVVDVPQLLSPNIRVGMPLTVTDRSDTVRVTATVLRTAGALDPISRALRVEAELPGTELLAGSYVNVRVPTTGATQGLLLPNMVLGYGPQGPRVVVVGPNDALHWVDVRIVRDRGRELELEGVPADARVVLYPVPELLEGERVHAAERPTQPRPGR